MSPLFLNRILWDKTPWLTRVSPAAVLTKYKGPEMEKVNSPFTSHPVRPLFADYPDSPYYGHIRPLAMKVRFLSIQLPPGGLADSLATDERGYLDFIIKRYPNGPMSEHFHSMSPGQRLDIKGPLPKYPWEENKHKHIALLAGGTGITP